MKGGCGNTNIRASAFKTGPMLIWSMVSSKSMLMLTVAGDLQLEKGQSGCRLCAGTRRS